MKLSLWSCEKKFNREEDMIGKLIVVGSSRRGYHYLAVRKLTNPRAIALARLRSAPLGAHRREPQQNRTASDAVQTGGPINSAYRGIP